jgi:hypothetical protein
MWNSGQYFGCEFHKPIPQAAISAALLQSPFDQSSAAPPAETPGEDDETEEVDDRYPFGVRLRVIVGASLTLWALILWVAGIL